MGLNPLRFAIWQFTIIMHYSICIDVSSKLERDHVSLLCIMNARNAFTFIQSLENVRLTVTPVGLSRLAVDGWNVSSAPSPILDGSKSTNIESLSLLEVFFFK